jgi:hypothetical protein
MVTAVVMCGSETCAMSEVDMKILGTYGRKILRRMHGLMVEQGIWRIRKNQELRELYNITDIVTDIKKKRLERIGNIV